MCLLIDCVAGLFIDWFIDLLVYCLVLWTFHAVRGTCHGTYSTESLPSGIPCKWYSVVGWFICWFDELCNVLTCWLIVWLRDLLVDWLIDRLVYWLLGVLIMLLFVWLICWLVDWFIDCVVGWLLDCLIALLVYWLVCCLVSCLVALFVDWLVDWLSGWLVRLLIVWLISWFVDWLFGCVNLPQEIFHGTYSTGKLPRETFQVVFLARGIPLIWLVDWLVYLLIDRLVEWLIAWLISCLMGVVDVFVACCGLIDWLFILID